MKKTYIKNEAIDATKEFVNKINELENEYGLKLKIENEDLSVLFENRKPSLESNVVKIKRDQNGFSVVEEKLSKMTMVKNNFNYIMHGLKMKLNNKFNKK